MPSAAPSSPAPPVPPWLAQAWRHRLFLAILKSLGLLVAALFLWLGPRHYEATAWVEVPPSEGAGAVREETLRTHEARLRLPSLLARALGGQPDAAEIDAFQRSLSVHLLRRTALIGITVRDASPPRARDRANAVAQAYLKELADTREETLLAERDQWAEQRDRARLAWETAEKALQQERFAPPKPAAPGETQAPAPATPANPANAAFREAALLAASRSASLSYEAALGQLHGAVTRLNIRPPDWRVEPATLPLEAAWPNVWLTLLAGAAIGGFVGLWVLRLRQAQLVSR